MYLMANAVAGAGKAHAVLAGHGLYIAVVVGIFEAALQRIVVDVGHGKFRAHARHVHGLQRQIGHGAGGVLRKRLVDAQSNFCAGGHLSANKVAANNLLRNCIAHASSPPET